MTKQTFAQMQQELDETIAKLESVDTDIDKAIKLHKEARALIKKLEKHLETASNEIKHLK